MSFVLKQPYYAQAENNVHEPIAQAQPMLWKQVTTCLQAISQLSLVATALSLAARATIFHILLLPLTLSYMNFCIFPC